MQDENFLNDLIQQVQQGRPFKYLYFWRHTPKQNNHVDKSCFSQWFPSPFKQEGIEYLTAEHYMMAQKAKLFNDDEIFQQILKVTTRMKQNSSVGKYSIMTSSCGRKSVLRS